VEAEIVGIARRKAIIDRRGNVTVELPALHRIATAM
jgi:hypothetical protein